MRLIDAEFLKVQVQGMYMPDYVRAGLNTVIDNAPTVFTCNACKNMGNERECVDCHDYSNYVHYEERPQGEWKITQDEKFYHYKCPFCGFWAMGDFLRTNGNLDLPNFCEKCGADMRGEKK